MTIIGNSSSDHNPLTAVMWIAPKSMSTSRRSGFLFTCCDCVVVVLYQKKQALWEIMMSEMCLIYLSGRSREGKYSCGFLNDTTPPCRGYYSFKPDTGKIYSLDDAVVILKEITAGHPGAVVIFKPI
jgi:hypothetical protein